MHRNRHHFVRDILSNKVLSGHPLFLPIKHFTEYSGSNTLDKADSKVRLIRSLKLQRKPRPFYRLVKPPTCIMTEIREGILNEEKEVGEEKTSEKRL